MRPAVLGLDPRLRGDDEALSQARAHDAGCVHEAEYGLAGRRRAAGSPDRRIAGSPDRIIAAAHRFAAAAMTSMTPMRGVCLPAQRSLRRIK